jgi:flavin reductase (DIM6/NTAB) family NADH-FMN oxidoreductase RutF
VKQEILLQRAHRLLAGRPACLMTTHYRGKSNIMTLSWTCPVSITPPLVLIAVHASRYSHGLLERSQEFVLNIPGRPLAEHLARCGTQSGADVDKTLDDRLTIEAGRRVSAPWIEQCLAHLECAVVEHTAPGDHSLFVAEIVGAWAEEEAFDQVWRVDEQPEDLVPLAHLGGASFGMLGTRVDLA